SCAVSLDRIILAEAGLGFTLTQKQIASLGPSELTDAANADAGSKREDVGDLPLEWSILYNDEAQTLKSTGAAGQYTAPEPAEGKTLAIRLINKLPAKEDQEYQMNNRIGVVILVNGKSTWNSERNLPIVEFKKWFLYPGKKEEFEGSYSEEEKQ